MRCPRCNQALEDGAVFCGNCGAQIAPLRAPGATVAADQRPAQMDQAETVLSQRSMPPLAGSYAPSPDSGNKFTPAPSRGPGIGRIALIAILVLVVVAGGTIALLSFLRNNGSTTGGTQNPPAVTISGQVFFTDGQNGSDHTDALIISVNGLSTPPSGSQYYAWLVNTDSEQTVPLGTLTPKGRVFSLKYAGDGKDGHAGTNLIGAGNKVEITLEPGAPNLPTHKVLASATFPPLPFIHIRHLLFKFPNTPHHTGLLVGLRDQAQLVNAQATALKVAANGGNGAAVQCLTQSIIDIIEGRNGGNYRPLAQQCAFLNVITTGDGYGILGDGGYVATAAAHASLAATAAGSTLNIQTHAKHVQICTANINGWLSTVDRDAVNLLANPHNTANVSEIAQLSDHAYNGVDTNGDESVDPVPGEGGAITAYNHGQLMAALTLSAGG